MAIQPIRYFGDPVLTTPASPVTDFDKELRLLVKDLTETMIDAPGAGLAAPQIGKSIRLFIIDGSPFANEEGEELDTKAIGIENFKKVFINPIIEEESGEKWAFQEGCLSIPKIRENVIRHEKLLISYYDENWKFHEEHYDGYAARIIQHEYDHIEGVLFTDHLPPLKRKMLTKRLQNITSGNIEIDYKMRFPETKKSKLL